MSDYQVWLPGETVAASRLQDLGLQGTYTPALQAVTTSPTLGSGATATADFLLHQGFVTVGFTIQFGTSGVAAGSGVYRLTLPTAGTATPALDLGLDADWQDNRALGQAWVNDAGTNFYMFFIRASSSNPDTVVFQTSASPTASVTNSVPFTWAANDYIRGSFEYKTDFT